MGAFRVECHEVYNLLSNDLTPFEHFRGREGRRENTNMAKNVHR